MKFLRRLLGTDKPKQEYLDAIASLNAEMVATNKLNHRINQEQSFHLNRINELLAQILDRQISVGAGLRNSLPEILSRIDDKLFNMEMCLKHETLRVKFDRTEDILREMEESLPAAQTHDIVATDEVL